MGEKSETPPTPPSSEEAEPEDKDLEQATEKAKWVAGLKPKTAKDLPKKDLGRLIEKVKGL